MFCTCATIVPRTHARVVLLRVIFFAGWKHVCASLWNCVILCASWPHLRVSGVTGLWTPWITSGWAAAPTVEASQLLTLETSSMTHARWGRFVCVKDKVWLWISLWRCWKKQTRKKIWRIQNLPTLDHRLKDLRTEPLRFFSTPSLAQKWWICSQFEKKQKPKKKTEKKKKMFTELSVADIFVHVQHCRSKPEVDWVTWFSPWSALFIETSPGYRVGSDHTSVLSIASPSWRFRHCACPENLPRGTFCTEIVLCLTPNEYGSKEWFLVIWSTQAEFFVSRCWI